MTNIASSMPPVGTRHATPAALLLVLGACSTLGTPASPPGPLPHGGTGQFRALTVAETMLGPAPAGLTLMTGGRAIDDAMPIEGQLFYAAASFRAVMPMDAGAVDAATAPDTGVVTDAGTDASVSSDASARNDADVDAGRVAPASIDWSLLDARQIFRSTPGAAWGFAAGTMMLAASETWEGGYVTDPWVVRRPDGRYLLYYAAAGGIGVASAVSLEGPWTREGTSAILPTTGAGTPRRPSAVATSGLEDAPAGAAVVLYYELAGTIRVASSSDGITLHDDHAIAVMPIAARDDRDGVETEVGAPGAISVLTPAGRHVVRVYYESRRSNGAVLIGMLGSGDGVSHFDQSIIPVFAERDRQRPAARVVDGRTTMLYTWVPSATTGAEIASITPAAVHVNHVAPTTF